MLHVSILRRISLSVLFPILFSGVLSAADVTMPNSLAHSTHSLQVVRLSTNVVKIDGNLYRIQQGRLFPLFGIAIKWFFSSIVPAVISQLKEEVVGYFQEKGIELVNSALGRRSDVEEITLTATGDNQADGNIALSSQAEDHDHNQAQDNTESVEVEDASDQEQLGDNVQSVLDEQLEYVDQYYEGDIDGDGKDGADEAEDNE